MAEPTASNYPSSYEDNDSLLGPLEERQVAVVKTAIGVAELQITLEEPLTGLTGPLIMLFEGGEMWWVEDSGISVAGGDTIITVASSAQRAYHNSILQPHGSGEEGAALRNVRLRRPAQLAHLPRIRVRVRKARLQRIEKSLWS